VIAVVAIEGDDEIREAAVAVLHIPLAPELLTPIDVDQPRNLANQSQ
jgi:hypothetical protein